MTTKLLNNRYQVIQVLGAGGFGETSLAEDTHLPSRRRLVIKELKPITNDPKTSQMVQQRFEREAAILENLGENSEQIPQLYAYFPENGKFYLVQEWIQGQTLTNIIESQGKLNETVVREILLSLLPVLDYVHSKGIIHRDIKPDNIIIRSHDNKPVLIDFGAVKETIRTVINTAGNPTQSIVIGTPGYMPSEQGIGRPVYASDIYSLGLTAIYLLTGKQPQELETDPHTGQILWETYATGTSPEIVKILTQAIEPRPSDRYTTASKMLYDLQSGHNITSHSPTTSATIAISPGFIPNQQHPPTPSPTKNPLINPRYLQKPPVIIAGVIIGSLIGAVAISSITRQPQPSTSIATNSSVKTESETTKVLPKNSSTAEITPSASVQPTTNSSQPFIQPSTNQPVIDNTPTAKRQQQQSQPENVFANTNQNEGQKNRNLDQQPNGVSIEQIFADDRQNQPQKNRNLDQQPNGVSIEEIFADDRKNRRQKRRQRLPQLNANNIRENLPAFPTGTSRREVEATLGKPKKYYRGYWGNTRATTYKIVPNQIDLGYLFDRKSGRLRQTEAGFAKTVDPQIVQSTFKGMLGGQTTPKIQQGLQQIQERQINNFTFTQGGIKGQIIRQNCGDIYISVWEADLHDFVNPATANKC